MQSDGSLPNSSADYRGWFDNAPVALVAVGDDGVVLVANEMARRLGVDVESILDALARGGTEARLVDSAGRLRAFAVDETRLGMVRLFAIRDVTEQCALEHELSHLRRLESIGYITASVAHDFNNLLMPMTLNSTLLEQCLTEGSQEGQMAAEIGMAAQRAASLVRQVLTLARRREGEKQRVDVNRAIAAMKWLVERVVRETVDVVVSLSDAPLDVIVDSERLEHALLNLAANARDAMPEGGRITITTSTVPVSEDVEGAARGGPEYVSIAVADTGSGMPPDVRDRIFETFFTTKDEGTGTGIGFAAVRRFVDASGGCLSVRSAVGEGTVVILYLPRARPPAAHPFDDAITDDGDTPGPTEASTARDSWPYCRALPPAAPSELPG